MKLTSKYTTSCKYFEENKNDAWKIYSMLIEEWKNTQTLVLSI